VKKDLVTRASVVRRPTERTACHEQEGRIDVELLRSVPTDLGHRVPIGRNRLRRELDILTRVEKTDDARGTRKRIERFRTIIVQSWRGARFEPPLELGVRAA